MDKPPPAADPRLDGLRLLLSAEEISARIDRLAEEISRDFSPGPVHAIAVLNGSFVFAADLIRRITLPATVDFLSAASYAGSASTGAIRIRKDLDVPPTGRRVLLVEDIVDTGLTLLTILEHLKKTGPAEIRICTLLDKPSRRKAALEPDYRGFTVGDEFVVGYGLDYNERYRELPGVYCVSPEAT